MGTATMAASSARWCAREGSRGGNGAQGKREAVEGVEASPWRREGVGEAATAKQEVAGALRARATEQLRGEGEEDDRGRSGGGLGRWRSWARQVSQVSGWASLFFKFSVLFVLFNIFCHCFEFKQIQTMPKTPLNIFILLDGLFQKLIKYFRDI